MSSSLRLLLVTVALLVSLPAALASANAPLNDKRSQPATINGNGGSLNGDTSFATVASDYPMDWEGDKVGTGAHSVWYRWTAPKNGRVVLAVSSFTFDPVIEAHPAGDGSIWRSDANTDANGNASVGYYVRAGQQFDVKVDGRTAQHYGSFKITATFDDTPAAPGNDAFGIPDSLGTGTSAKRDVHTLFAGNEALETDHRGVNTAHSVWFTWTPASSGGTRISLDCGWSTDFFSDDPVVAVYKGSSLTGLKSTEVPYYSTAVFDPDCPRSTVTFVAAANQTYRIVVDAGPGAVGESPLTLDQETETPVVTFGGGAVFGPNQVIGFYGEMKDECLLDGKAVACDGSVKLVNAAAGWHTLKVRTTDAYGNVSAWATKTFKVETTAPETTITAGPPPHYKGGQPTIEFTADKAATFECKMDAKYPGAWASCKSGWEPLWQADGQKVTVSVRAKDAFGNVEPTPATRSWVVDTKPPGFDTQSPYPQSPVGSPITWMWTTNEPATFACSTVSPSGPFKPCTSPHTEPGLDAAGGRSLFVRATDAAGNVATSHRYGYHSPIARTTTPTTTTTNTTTTPVTTTTTSTRTTTFVPRFFLAVRAAARSITKKRLARKGLPFEARCRPSCVMTVRLVTGKTILATLRTRSKGTLKLGPAARRALKKVRMGSSLSLIVQAPGTTTTQRIRVAG